MTTDPWVTANVTKPEVVVGVRKYRVIDVPDPAVSEAVVESSDGSQFTIKFPNSLTPALSAWVWCLHTNGQVWPFAVD